MMMKRHYLLLRSLLEEPSGSSGVSDTPRKAVIKIPKVPPDELPRKEIVVKKKSPEERAKDIVKAVSERRAYLRKVINDFYDVIGRTGIIYRNKNNMDWRA